MRLPNNFVINFAALFAISEAVFKCPTLFNWYPDIYDCSKFYRCMWGKSNSFNCPSGTLWSQELLTCDHKDHVKCDARTASAPIYHAHGHTHSPKPRPAEAPDFSVDYKLDVAHHGELNSEWKSEEEEYQSSHGEDSGNGEHKGDYEASFEYDDGSHDTETHSHDHYHDGGHEHEHESITDHSEGESEYHSHEHLVSDPHGSSTDDDKGYSDDKYEYVSHSHNDDGYTGGGLYGYEDSVPVYESTFYEIPIYPEEDKSIGVQPTYILQQPSKSTVVQQPASVIVKSPQPLVQPPAQIVVQQPQKSIQAQPPILISHAEIVPTGEVAPDHSSKSQYTDYVLSKLLQLPRYGGHFYKPINVINTDGTYDVVDIEVSPIEMDKLQKIEPYKSRRPVLAPRWPMTDFFRAGYGYKKIYHKK